MTLLKKIYHKKHTLLDNTLYCVDICCMTFKSCSNNSSCLLETAFDDDCSHCKTLAFKAISAHIKARNYNETWLVFAMLYLIRNYKNTEILLIEFSAKFNSKLYKADHESNCEPHSLWLLYFDNIAASEQHCSTINQHVIISRIKLKK